MLLEMYFFLINLEGHIEKQLESQLNFFGRLIF